MGTKITRDIVESYLHCKFKGHLKLKGQQGSKCDYETLLTEMSADVRLAAIDKILARHPGEEIPRNIPLSTAALNQGASFLLDATLEDDHFSLVFDGLKKVEGASKLGDFHYIPMIFHEGRQVRKEQKLLLELYGLLLSQLQGQMPVHGVVWHGKECTATRVRLNADLRKTERLLRDLKEMGRAESPRLMLNDHCQVCEFRQGCRAEAVKEDTLSLLRGMSAKEIERQRQKGIFTVTQLSYTFRTRRKRKRVKQPSAPHHFPLQALAIREKKVFVHGTPTLSCNEPRIYFDLEGDPESNSYYLIGLIAVANGVEIQRSSFWANSDAEQISIFCSFLDFLGRFPDCSLLHYGSFEVAALRRIKPHLPAPYRTKADDAIKRATNILSLIHPFIYFPTYSNGLKEVGHYLGHSWSAPTATGIQSIVWRRRWMRNHEEQLKTLLLQYNMEDCLALRTVVEFIEKIGSERRPDLPSSQDSSLPVVFTANLPKSESRKRVFEKKEFALKDFELINNCAYFDYQRDRVFARSHREIDKANKAKRRRKTIKLKLNKIVELLATRCQSCRSRKIDRGGQVRRLIIDLKFFRGGVKRWVVKHVAWRYHCSKCHGTFVPLGFPERTTKYGHSLVSWCIYQNIVCGQNMLQVKRGLFDIFGLRVPQPQLFRFKVAVAQFYREQYNRILADILRGHVLHIDETEVDLRGEKGYVWVVVSIDSVYYFFRESREGEFLTEFLKGFKGVLVSDFYTAYDSLEVPQQRCLIHLMRDLNEDLLKNPFDEDYKQLAGLFSGLLKAIVHTIDKHGLKQKHLRKHRAGVEDFFAYVQEKEFATEVAQKYQQRFQKYEKFLFAFLDYDCVPWNNNNAEHAIKAFARYRRFADGRFSELSIRDYLILLSVCQTCEFRGADPLQFLLAEERDRGMSFGAGKRLVLPVAPQADLSSSATGTGDRASQEEVNDIQ